METLDLAKLTRFLARIVGVQDAEDVAQDAYVQAWRRRDSFRSEAAFETWVYAVAKRQALDHLREVKRRAVVLEAWRPDTLVAPAPLGFDDARLARLTPADHALFSAREVYGSQAEAAAALGLTRGQFKGRLARARKRMREA